MSDLEEQVASHLRAFGALTTEQQALVNAFAEMVRRGQVPIPRGGSSQNQGGLPQGEEGNDNSTQVENPMERLDDKVETDSLRIELQQMTCSSWENGRVKSWL